MANHRTATVLKILKGTAQRDPKSMRDESKVTPKGAPELPPWVEMSADVRAVYDWLVREFVLPGVHGRPDGLLIHHLAELIVMRNRSMAKLQEFGPVMKHPQSGRPMLQPYHTAATTYTDQVKRYMGELGFTPSGRLKFAPPASGPLGAPASWDEID
jgi:phage terminase small subunit